MKSAGPTGLAILDCFVPDAELPELVVRVCEGAARHLVLRNGIV